jgi:hypothetical protein
MPKIKGAAPAAGVDLPIKRGRGVPKTKTAAPAAPTPGFDLQIKRGRGRPSSGKPRLTSAEKMRLARARLAEHIRQDGERFGLCAREIFDAANHLQDTDTAERIRRACAKMRVAYDTAIRDLRRTNGIPSEQTEPAQAAAD